jgi:asparagine synthase (glutamine-hydrolysing)
MGLRYLIAVARDGQNYPPALEATTAAAGLSRVASGRGYRLYLNMPDRWARFGDGRGIVAGDLFARVGAVNTWAISSGQFARAGDFSELQQHYWGGYVALWLGDRGCEVFRDPSGALPAYHIERDDGWYIASDAPLLAETGLYTPQIDWNQVAWFFYTNGLPGEQTALAGLRQIVPGVALPSPFCSLSARLLWSPWTHVAAADAGAEELRATITRCVQAWQIHYGAIVAGVSGGLDSSVVACSLDRTRKVTAITVSTDDAQGDETPYAATLCEALNIPLERARYALEAVNVEQPSLPHRPFPGGMAQLQAYDAAVIEVVRRQDAAAFFSGVGGDNVFQLTHSARPLVDRLLAKGPTRGALSTLSDICRLTGARPLMALREAARVPWRPGPKYRWPTDTRLLDAAMLANLDERPRRHPWLEAPRDCLPGEHAHVAMILRAHAYLDCHDRRSPFASIHPLMSQPVLELTLATPSWIACEGGVDRARARHAFSDAIPAAVLNRRLKGGPDGFAAHIMRSHRDAIRAILLDGRLVRERLVDRDELEQALTEDSLMRGHNYARLLQLLDTEAWARNWLAMGDKARALLTGCSDAASPSIAQPLPDAVDRSVAGPEART